MDLLSQPVGVAHYMIVSAVLFVCGAVCMAVKRNALGVLMGIELVLSAAIVNFVAFSSRRLQANADDAWGSMASDGAVYHRAGAAEAAVALAIVLNFYNNHASVDVDRGNELKG